MQLIKNAQENLERIAVVEEGKKFSFQDILSRSEKIAAALLQGRPDLNEARIAFLVAPRMDYASLQWGIWRAGGIAVPLGLSYPAAELEYALKLVTPEILVYGEAFKEIAEEVCLQTPVTPIPIASLSAPKVKLPEISTQRRAMMLFTSGTTSRPKAVVSTHENIENQISCLIEAWEWSRDDKILNVLPLHHTHGIINVMSCAFWAGATVGFMPKFNPEKVWKRFAEGDLSLFMAVPTIYKRLIDFWETQDPERQKQLSQAAKTFRLMVSGSAALPVSVLEKWEKITGQRLLERYGMTEIGMCLSNPYRGERRAGTVGQPLPGVTVRLVDAENQEVGEGEQGEIQVKGKNVFLEYWENEAATKRSFVDGWFQTGDVALLEEGYFRILGRSSVDILKSGGYKISALEIEEVLRSLPGIVECAVVGLADEDLGEKVVAALVVNEAYEEKNTDTKMQERLARYKCPREYKLVKKLPRNALGKVMKPKVKELWNPSPPGN